MILKSKQKKKSRKKEKKKKTCSTGEHLKDFSQGLGLTFLGSADQTEDFPAYSYLRHLLSLRQELYELIIYSSLAFARHIQYKNLIESFKGPAPAHHHSLFHQPVSCPIVSFPINSTVCTELI